MLGLLVGGHMCSEQVGPMRAMLLLLWGRAVRREVGVAV